MLLPKPRRAAGAAHGSAATAKAATSKNGLLRLLTPTILSLTGFFALLSLTNSAMQNFSVVALLSEGITLGMANAALTAWLFGGAVGVLIGGYLADRTDRHGDVAAVGFGLTAVLVLGVATLSLSGPVIAATLGLAGLLSGMIMPSRDMLVRKAAPPGAAGRVFGIVSTGFNIGGIIGPLAFGWIMDHAKPSWVFGGAVAIMALTALVGLIGERYGDRQGAARRVA